MIHLLGHFANVVLPVALCVLTGVALARLGVPFDRKMIGGLVQTVGYPTLIISNLSAGHVALKPFLTTGAAAAAAIAVFVCAAGLFLWRMRLPLRAFIAPMTLNNAGNIGLPVAVLSFGDEGLSYALAFMIVVMIGVFTYGTWVPKGRVSVRGILTSPVIYAIVVALLLLYFQVKLPKPLASGFDILGGIAIPLMLLILGHSLASLRLSSLRRGLVLAGFHLAMGAITGFALAALFGFTGTQRAVFILMTLMPVAVSSYLFVELYASEHAGDVASLILVSTLLTVAVVPFVLAFGL